MLKARSWVYNIASEITSTTEDTETINYTYDLGSQLISETRPGYSASYTYDANGNRLSKTVNGIVDTYAYGAADKLLSVTSPNGNKTYGYDLAGRTTSINGPGGLQTFTYDYESRIASHVKPNYSETMAYNGLDARMNRTYTQGGTTTSLTTHRAGVSATAPILKEGGANFTPGVSERRQGTTRQNSGGIKNMDLQTMPDGSFFGSRRYDAFGGHLQTTGSWYGPNGYGGSVGYQEVPQSGLKLLGHRYYDSSTGRFLTRDPIKDGGNWYSYCGNNPVTRADPSGLFLETAFDAVMVGISLAQFAADPTLENGAALALDTASLLAPGIPAVGGTMVRAASKADDAIDAARAAGNALEEAAKHGNRAGNKSGRRGGPAHQYQVAEVEDYYKGLTGYSHKSGGSKPERKKGNRYPDLEFEDPDGNLVFINVGKQNKNATPVKRERDAIRDLESWLEIHGPGIVLFVPYN